jgi:hypothetical protein
LLLAHFPAFLLSCFLRSLACLLVGLLVGWLALAGGTQPTAEQLEERQAATEKCVAAAEAAVVSKAVSQPGS